MTKLLQWVLSLLNVDSPTVSTPLPITRMGSGPSSGSQSQEAFQLTLSTLLLLTPTIKAIDLCTMHRHNTHISPLSVVRSRMCCRLRGALYNRRVSRWLDRGRLYSIKVLLGIPTNFFFTRDLQLLKPAAAAVGVRSLTFTEHHHHHHHY